MWQVSLWRNVNRDRFCELKAVLSAHIKSSSVSSGESETISVSLLDDWSTRRFFRSILGESDSCELLRGFSDLNRFYQKRKNIFYQYFIKEIRLTDCRWCQCVEEYHHQTRKSYRDISSLVVSLAIAIDVWILFPSLLTCSLDWGLHLAQHRWTKYGRYDRVKFNVIRTRENNLSLLNRWGLLGFLCQIQQW